MRRWLHAGIAAGAIALALGLGGCTDGDEPADDPVTAIRALQSAFAADDLAAICERMGRGARKDAGEVAHGSPTTCRADLRRAFDLIERGGRWGAKPAIRKVETDEDRATVVVEQRDGWRATVPLAKEDGVWKLASFFGAAAREFDASDRSLRERPFPRVRGGRPVEVVDGNGRPCGELSDKRYPDIEGGCTLVVRGRDVPVRMLTPFGNFKFANCEFDYWMSVDSRGRTWTYYWIVDGLSTSGCSDIGPCNTEAGTRPWKGQIVADGEGGFLHHVDVCIRTCIGRFGVGAFVTRLVRHRNGWRIAPTLQGSTGFKIDGDLRVIKGDVEIRPI